MAQTPAPGARHLSAGLFQLGQKLNHKATVNQEIVDWIALFKLAIGGSSAHRQPFRLEDAELVEQPLWSTWQRSAVGSAAEIAADDPHNFARIVVVCFRIIARKV